MTPAELRQIDAQVAVKVIGKDERFCKMAAEYNCKWSRNYLPFYTSNKEAAMEVLEKCIQKANYPIETGRTKGKFYLWFMTDQTNEIFAEAETLPLAICLFALEVFK